MNEFKHCTYNGTCQGWDLLGQQREQSFEVDVLEAEKIVKRKKSKQL